MTTFVNDRSSIRINAALAVLAKTDRIMSGKTVNVMAVNSGLNSGVASTNGSDIYIGHRLFGHGNIDRSTARKLLGVNYHELCHVLWTDFTGWKRGLRKLTSSKGPRGVMGPASAPFFTSAFNILEDQRIEARWMATYSKDILSGAVLDVIHESLVNGKLSVADSWLILAGRVWLPDDIRHAAYTSFTFENGQDKADKVAAIVDSYQRLGNTITDEHLDHVCDLAELLNDGYVDILGGESNDMSRPQDDSGIDVSDLLGDGPTIPTGDTEPDDDGDPDGATGASEPGDDDDGGGGEGEGGNGDEGSDGPRTLVMSRKGGDEYAEPIPGLGDMVSMIEDEVRWIEEESASDVIDGLIGGIDKLIKSGRGIHPEPIENNEMIPPPSTFSVRNRISRTLGRIQDAAERGWVPDNRGRFNVVRHIQDVANGRMSRAPFDSWDDESSRVGINMVVLLDISGSISDPGQVGQAGWILKSAMDAIDGECEVIAFNTAAWSVYEAERRTSRIAYKAFHSQGGTDPSQALEYASMRLLGASDGIPVLVIVTDGAWNDDDKCDAMVEALNNAGVTTVLYGLEGATAFGDHNCQVSMDLATIMDMPRMVEALVAKLMRRRVTV